MRRVRFSLLVAAVLIAATLAIYAQAFGFPFVNWDDPLYVTKNAEVQQGLTRESVAWAFSETQRINWHPLTWLSHMADFQIYGWNAGGHHATSVALHLANSLLVYALFLSMTGARWRSAALALLFAIHPLHVESVAWISDRKDLLCSFLSLLATAAYVAYARRGGAARYALVALLLVLALMAKAMAVTLPLVFLLLDHWPLRRAPSRALVVEKLPLLAICAATSVVTWLTQAHAGAMVRAEPLPLLARLANAVVSYGRYLARTVWPTDLTFFYPHPYIPESGGLPLAATEIAAWALLLAAVSFAVFRYRETRWALVGWLWFLGTLVPVIGLVQVGHQGMSDRYTYFPSIGLLWIAAWGAGELGLRLRARPALARAGALAGVAVLAALGVAAWRQTATWQSSLVLFQHAIDAVPRNPTIRFNLANHLRDAGETELAVAHYRRTLAETPDEVGPNINLANLLQDQGALDEAIRLYLHVLEVEPRHQRAHVNLGSAYRRLGDVASAELHYRRALEVGPDALALFNLANLLGQQGLRAEATSRYREALALEPGDPRIHNNLGAVLLDDGQSEAAAEQFAEVLRLEPRHFRAANNLGLALQALGRLDEAIEAYQYALKLQPDYASAKDNLDQALRVRSATGSPPRPTPR